MIALVEADVESVALEWLATLGWRTAHGPDIAPDTPNAERPDYGTVALERRLRDALAQCNPDLLGSVPGDDFRTRLIPTGFRGYWKRGG